MTSLNLPPFDVRLKGTKQAPLIFDFLRRRYVRLTPEEWVRQHFVHFMVEHRHYPASLLANEVSLHVGSSVAAAAAYTQPHGAGQFRIRAGAGSSDQAGAPDFRGGILGRNGRFRRDARAVCHSPHAHGRAWG